MTTKRIIYTRGDNGVSVIVPAPIYIAQLMAGGNTEDQAIAIVQEKNVPSDAADITVVAAVLSDRTFRNAWRQIAGVISVDMPTARDIHAERMGAAHAAEIARLKINERKERLKSNIAQANSHAATVVALEALDLNVLATQIAAAPNPTALSAIWPALVPRI